MTLSKKRTLVRLIQSSARVHAPLSSDLQRPVFNLLKARKLRKKETVQRLKESAAISAAGTSLANLSMTIHPGTPTYAKVGMIIGAVTAPIILAHDVFTTHRESVLNATAQVGVALGKKAKTDYFTRRMLQTHRFVFVDKKGNICCTNQDRVFGMGRLRIPTSLILHRKSVEKIRQSFEQQKKSSK